MRRPETPFAGHWRYCIVLKYAIIVAAFPLALKYFAVW
jgi:hypothetical protein